jgi:Brp/Blh family beta-carotene 15,15'-monooxygenase
MMQTTQQRSSGETSATTRQLAVSYVVRPGWLALAAVAVVSVAVSATIGDIPRTVQYAPLLVSVLLLGLPHGAVDHLLLPRSRGQSLSLRSLAVVGAVYAGFGTAYAAGWFLWPTGAFVLFILITWFHWGQGELHPLLALVGASYLRVPGQRALTVLVRGGAPMLVPLVAFPGEYEFVATTLVGLFDAGAASALDPVFTLGTRFAVGAVYAALVALTLGRGYLRATDHTPWLVDAGELLGLTLYFLVVPPILAIGVYFCFWHSLRHVGRTVLLDDRSTWALDRGEVWPAARRFVRDAAPLTALSLVVLGALAVLVPRTPGSVPDLVGLYLVFIAVLTLPHVVIVTLLDREQAIL